MAERYFQTSKTEKRILGATKKCYVIAAENAMQITKLFQDDGHPVKAEMNTKIAQNLQIAEAIQQKINSDPTCDAKKVFFASHDQVEQIIIEKSATVRMRHFDVWQPETGIIK